MSLLKIARMGHPVLRAVAAAVDDPTAPDVHRLAGDMLETMRDAPGVGLAAPQVYAPLRMVVLRVPPERNGGRAEPEMVLINPVLTPLDAGNDDEVISGWEGCLSVPGWRGVVPRHHRVGLRALDLDGRLVEREAEGFFARVLQHEIDHLDGVLYVQRIPDLRLLAFNEEARHVEDMLDAMDQQESGQAVLGDEV